MGSRSLFSRETRRVRRKPRRQEVRTAGSGKWHARMSIGSRAARSITPSGRRSSGNQSAPAVYSHHKGQWEVVFSRHTTWGNDLSVERQIEMRASLKLEIQRVRGELIEWLRVPGRSSHVLQLGQSIVIGLGADPPFLEQPTFRRLLKHEVDELARMCGL